MKTRILDFVATGKGFSAVVVGTTLLFILSLFSIELSFLARGIFSIVVVLFGIILILLIRELKKIRGEQKAFNETRVQRPPRVSQSHVRESEIAQKQNAKPDASEHLNYFAPDRISGAVILGKPSSHVPGRMAAEQQMSEDPRAKYRQLVGGRNQNSRPRVAVVGVPSPTLKAKTLVDQMVPGQAAENIDISTSYLIIDGRTLNHTAWRNVLDASETLLFMQLFDVIQEAKDNGSIVVYRESEVISHFSWSLREQSDIIIRGENVIEGLPHPGTPLRVLAWI